MLEGKNDLVKSSSLTLCRKICSTDEVMMNTNGCYLQLLVEVSVVSHTCRELCVAYNFSVLRHRRCTQWSSKQGDFVGSEGTLGVRIATPRDYDHLF